MVIHSRAGAGPVHMRPGVGDSTSGGASAGAGAASSRFRLSDGTNTTCSTAVALVSRSLLTW